MDDIAKRPGNRQGSGQALLLVMLGEFVWRKQEAVWSSALVAALAEFGVTENAARKALQRSAESGIISLHRVGRQAQCALTDAGKQLMLTGAERVFGFRGESPEWDGRWLVVTVTVPETRRQARHYLKTRFMWTGLGSPAPGVWITPHINGMAKTILGKLELEEEAFSYIGHFGPVGNEAEMVRAAWDIGELERSYQDFIDTFKGLRPKPGQAVFCAFVNLVQAWRRFPYIDPQLPVKFLPDPWIGRRAAELMHEKRERWSAGATEFWNELHAQWQ